jgi:hypothetical protein
VGQKSDTPKHFAINYRNYAPHGMLIVIIFGTVYLTDISPLLVKFQPYKLNTCKMTGKLKLQVKNCHAGLVAYTLRHFSR